MHLRVIGRQFTQMNAYFLVMNSKRCTRRTRRSLVKLALAETKMKTTFKWQSRRREPQFPIVLSSHSIYTILVKYALTGVRADDLNFYRVTVCKFHVVLNMHRIVLKSVPHVQHDYFSSFDQLNS